MTGARVRAALTIALTALLPLPAVFLAYYARTTQDSTAILDAPNLYRNFRAHAHAQLFLYPAEIFPIGAGTSLIDPAEDLPHTFLYAPAELQALLGYTRTCTSSDVPSGLSEPLAAPLSKALKWARFVCGQLPALPADFFFTPPYIHPLGGSFAARALRPGAPPLAPELRARLGPYFHVLEPVPGDLDLSPALRLLHGLDERALTALHGGDRAVLTEHSLLLKSFEFGDSTTSEYIAFARSDWDRYLRSTPFRTRPRGWTESACLQTSPGICWSLAPQVRWRRWGLAALLSLAILALVLYGRHLAVEKRQAARLRFALRMLAHELRTPLTVLGLELENLEPGKPTPETPLIRAREAAARLQRLAERSRLFLSAEHAGAIQIEKVYVPDAHEFVRHALGLAIDDPILVTSPPLDFNGDAAWLAFCLQNIYANALRHGQAPVRVRIELDHTHLVFCVDDAGNLPVSSLRRLRQAVTPQRGLGWGLALVDTVARALGGRLEIHAKPTSFRLRIPRGVSSL